MTMDPDQWLRCTDPRPMLEFVHDKTSDRKLRLFGCACLRRTWRLLTDPRSQMAVEVNERYADGLAALNELRLAQAGALQATREAWGATRAAREAAERAGPREAKYLLEFARAREADYEVKWAAAWLGEDEPERTARLAAWAAAWTTGATKAEEEGFQCALLHDLFDDLVRPVFLPPTGRMRRLRALARSIYDGRHFDGLPLVADDLEERGVADPVILSHCRSGGEHVRGCWVIDQILSLH
jgi:hypothetical protein